MNFRGSATRNTKEVLPKAKNLKVSEAKLTAFGISPEGWDRLVKEEAEVANVRKNLTDIQMEYDYINRTCALGYHVTVARRSSK
ncbi:hypothetical protein RclHR1_01140011 [Rhizophagus clarus]|nr:hypothetical protein RclHR1_01140011 [Rhizophagus clarus]